MFEKLKSTFCYGGLTKYTYQKYEELLLERDISNLQIYIIIGGAIYALVGVASLIATDISYYNTAVYFLAALAMAALWVVRLLLMKSKNCGARGKRILIYAYISIVYLEAISLTVYHTQELSVTFIGVLVLLPILFSRRPISIASIQVLYVALFCYFVQRFKIPEVAYADCWNATAFLFLSLAVIFTVVPIRICGTVKTQMVKELSEYDLLTGLKNRNSFEEDTAHFAKEGRNAVLIYADGDGLHELNQTKGHIAGDVMLKTIAEIIRKTFGAEYSYRIGGDEFFVIYPDRNMQQADAMVAAAKRNIEGCGYSISFGCADFHSDEGDIHAALARAENAMFASRKNMRA